MSGKARRGWFAIPGVQDGDRTPAQQLKGLDYAFACCDDARVLDLGCAEGVIAREALNYGAASVHGVEVVLMHVAVAKRVCPGATFQVGDLNDEAVIAGLPHCDVIFALAILHKLRRPENLMRRIAQLGASLIVVRTPAATPDAVIDARSGMREVSISGNLSGYRLSHTDSGHFAEWVGYYMPRKKP